MTIACFDWATWDQSRGYSFAGDECLGMAFVERDCCMQDSSFGDSSADLAYLGIAGTDLNLVTVAVSQESSLHDWMSWENSNLDFPSLSAIRAHFGVGQVETDLLLWKHPHFGYFVGHSSFEFWRAEDGFVQVVAKADQKPKLCDCPLLSPFFGIVHLHF
eukprot:CAMPEP_0196587404 /NCGR_PEP_ID=MMETSP1081-20130531/57381_1 /TAXON_ID=36882 /ORGANISM="Pyramimonas amylifera, Strain CCMP720" /LENGTH=159 /DNA_ID=CAMNT_0041909585 /DNA_START=477 /DNA_END=956 /DNA_ORIENTATION=-